MIDACLLSPLHDAVDLVGDLLCRWSGTAQQAGEHLTQLRHREDRLFPPQPGVSPEPGTTESAASESCGGASPPNCAPHSGPAPLLPCPPGEPARRANAPTEHPPLRAMAHPNRRCSGGNWSLAPLPPSAAPPTARPPNRHVCPTWSAPALPAHRPIAAPSPPHGLQTVASASPFFAWPTPPPAQTASSEQPRHDRVSVAAAALPDPGPACCWAHRRHSVQHARASWRGSRSRGRTRRLPTPRHAARHVSVAASLRRCHSVPDRRSLGAHGSFSGGRCLAPTLWGGTSVGPTGRDHACRSRRERHRP